MIVSSVSHVQKVPMGLPATAARGHGPARLLSILFESRWSPRHAVSRRELRDHLGAMVPDQQYKRALADDLEPLGWGLVSWLRRFNVSVRVVSPEQLSNPRHGPFWSGLYRPEFKSVTLREDWRSSTAIHEMGHAIEHSLGCVCSMRGGRRPSIAPMLWHGFAKQRSGFVSDYAGTNPAEYFAESFAAVFDDRKSQKLASVDPGMHAFMAAIVDLSNVF